MPGAPARQYYLIRRDFYGSSTHPRIAKTSWTVLYLDVAVFACLYDWAEGQCEFMSAALCFFIMIHILAYHFLNIFIKFRTVNLLAHILI